MIWFFWNFVRDDMVSSTVDRILVPRVKGMESCAADGETDEKAHKDVSRTLPAEAAVKLLC